MLSKGFAIWNVAQIGCLFGRVSALNWASNRADMWMDWVDNWCYNVVDRVLYNARYARFVAIECGWKGQLVALLIDQ